MAKYADFTYTNGGGAGFTDVIPSLDGTNTLKHPYYVPDLATRLAQIPNTTTTPSTYYAIQPWSFLMGGTGFTNFQDPMGTLNPYPYPPDPTTGSIYVDPKTNYPKYENYWRIRDGSGNEVRIQVTLEEP